MSDNCNIYISSRSQAMAIYKQIIPKQDIHQERSQVTDGHMNSPVQMEDSDETYEYFSDREEAEKHKKKNAEKQKSPII